MLALMGSMVAGCANERTRELEDRIRTSRARVEAELERRTELAPDLVAVVDEAAAFEQERFPPVVQARAALGRARARLAGVVGTGASAPRLAEAEAEFERSLARFTRVSVAAYPALNADPGFTGLQDELASSADRMALARIAYNDAVGAWNADLGRFPEGMSARLLGAERREPMPVPPRDDPLPVGNRGPGSAVPPADTTNRQEQP